mgnify:CR=1 FL=1
MACNAFFERLRRFLVARIHCTRAPSIPWGLRNRSVLALVPAWVLAWGLAPLQPLWAQSAFAGQTPPNVLLIIADDLGIDRVGAYAAHPAPGNTPVIDQLAQDGVLFRNAWATPLCSATRATLLTGRHGYRTGIGSFLGLFTSAGELPRSETSLAQVLSPTTQLTKPTATPASRSC